MTSIVLQFADNSKYDHCSYHIKEKKTEINIMHCSQDGFIRMYENILNAFN